ncbi:death domain-containing protein 1-like [Lytechinus variegatus]|uniref:death domain-containing protein 1-like n=1 Tax=Lytechinus variegatus TaxID=7654 RepID=UPI001BB2CAB2|nr:death domain-containing protein 1-like [Lytechinus variegatus]
MSADDPKCSREAKKSSLINDQNETKSSSPAKADDSLRGSNSSLRDSTNDRVSVANDNQAIDDQSLNARPGSSMSSNDRPTSSKSRSHVSDESDFDDGTENDDGQSIQNMDALKGNRPKTGHHRRRQKDEPDVDDFSGLVSALRQETENLAAQFRDGPLGSINADDDKVETASIHDILEELTDSLQRSESRSSQVCGSIGKVLEATGELRDILEEKLNRSGLQVDREKSDDNKKGSTEAVAAAAETRATLARLTAEVAEANRMAAEAENAAAEARARAAEAADEITEAKDNLESIKEKEQVEEKDKEEEQTLANDAKDGSDNSVEEGENEKTDEAGEYDENFEEESDEDVENKTGDNDENTKKEEERDGDKPGREERRTDEQEEKADNNKRVLTPRLSMKENLLEWPYHVLPLKVNGEEEVGCVIRFKDDFFPPPSSLHLTCHLHNNLSTNAMDDSEEMVSNVIRLRHEDDDDDDEEHDDLGAPIVVAIPYTVSARMTSTKEFIVKMRGRNDEDWQTVATLATESTFIEQKGPFAEVKTTRLASFVVVARLARDKQTVTKKGGTLKSSADHRVTITYPMGACSLISVTLEVQPAENVVSEIKSRLRHCSELITASPIIHLTHSTKKHFEKPVTLTIPCPPNPHKSNDAPGGAGDSTGPGGGAGGGGGKKEKSTSNMDPLHPEGVVVIRSTKSSIFGGDPSQDALYLLAKQEQTSQWNELDDIPIRQIKKDVVAIDLSEPVSRLVILRVAQEARYPVKSIANTFELALQIRYAKLVFIPKEDEPHRAVVTCVPSKQLDNVLRKLLNDGYDGSPDHSDDIPMTEGQEITLRFNGNVQMVDRNELKINFHSNRRIFHYIELKEVNRFGNHSSPEYRGCAEFYGKARITLEDMEDPEETMLKEAEAKAKEKKTEKENKPISLKDEKKIKDNKSSDQSSFFKNSPDLLCKLHIALPKTEPDQPLPPSRYRTTAIDAGGMVCNSNLRWLASELGNEWESLAGYLGLKKNRVQSIKRNNPDAQEQQIFDMLVTWRSSLPKAYNKDRKILSSLTRCGRYDLGEELRYRDSEPDNEYAEDFED